MAPAVTKPRLKVWSLFSIVAQAKKNTVKLSKSLTNRFLKVKKLNAVSSNKNIFILFLFKNRLNAWKLLGIRNMTLVATTAKFSLLWESGR